jgi:hypothetical protein
MMSVISDIKEIIETRRRAKALASADLISEERAIELVRQYVDARGWEEDEPVYVANRRRSLFGAKPLKFRVRCGYPIIAMPSWCEVDRVTGEITAFGNHGPTPPDKP